MLIIIWLRHSHGHCVYLLWEVWVEKFILPANNVFFLGEMVLLNILMVKLLNSIDLCILDSNIHMSYFLSHKYIII